MFISLYFFFYSKLNDLRYSVDDDPFDVTNKVMESLSSSNKVSDKKVIAPEPSSYIEGEHSGLVDDGESGSAIPSGTKQRRQVGLTMSEEVDELIDHCIEIESNKRMIKENVKWFSLTFKSKDMELKVNPLSLLSLFFFILLNSTLTFR